LSTKIVSINQSIFAQFSSRGYQSQVCVITKTGVPEFIENSKYHGKTKKSTSNNTL
ncbi:MAG: hypothetical protein ACI8RD_006321, partial [Bacillariaceae sp.]